MNYGHRIISPSIMTAKESGADECSGCGKKLLTAGSVMVMPDESVVICRPCVDWASPQMEAVESCGERDIDE